MNGEDGILSNMTLVPRDKVNEFLDNRLFPDAPVYIMGYSFHILHTNARFVQVTPIDQKAFLELKQEIKKQAGPKDAAPAP
jgi:hypothetical protein